MKTLRFHFFSLLRATCLTPAAMRCSTLTESVCMSGEPQTCFKEYEGILELTKAKLFGFATELSIWKLPAQTLNVG